MEGWSTGPHDGRALLVAEAGGGVWLLQPDADGGAGALRWFGPARPLEASVPATAHGSAPLGRVIGACGQRALMLHAEGQALVASELWPPEDPASPPRQVERARAPAFGALSGAALSCGPAADNDLAEPIFVGMPTADGGAGGVYRWGAGQAPAPLLRGRAPGQLLGGTVIAGHDLNGDGIADLAASAWGQGNNAGAVWLLDGPVPADAEGPDRRWFSPREGDVAGFALAYAGDADHDGYPELLIGAHGADDADWSAGAAYLVDPRRRGPLSGALATYLGASANDRAGWAVDAGHDADADGRADLLIGAPGLDAGGAEAGGVFLESGHQRGTFVLSPAHALRLGPGPQAQLGEVIALLPAGAGVAFGRARRAPPGAPAAPVLERLQATPRR